MYWVFSYLDMKRICVRGFLYLTKRDRLKFPQSGKFSPYPSHGNILKFFSKQRVLRDYINNGKETDLHFKPYM